MRSSSSSSRSIVGQPRGSSARFAKGIRTLWRHGSSSVVAGGARGVGHPRGLPGVAEGGVPCPVRQPLRRSSQPVQGPAQVHCTADSSLAPQPAPISSLSAVRHPAPDLCRVRRPRARSVQRAGRGGSCSRQRVAPPPPAKHLRRVSGGVGHPCFREVTDVRFVQQGTPSRRQERRHTG